MQKKCSKLSKFVTNKTSQQVKTQKPMSTKRTMLLQVTKNAQRKDNAEAHDGLCEQGLYINFNRFEPLIVYRKLWPLVTAIPLRLSSDSQTFIQMVRRVVNGFL